MSRVAELEILLTVNSGGAQKQLNDFSGSFHRIIAGGIIERFGRSTVDMVKGWITSGAEFQQTMLRIDRLAGGAGKNVDALIDKAFQIDKLTIFSAQQVAESMEQLAREGFTPEEILGGYTEAAINFAAVIDEDVVPSAMIFGQIMRVFKDQNISAAEASDILSAAILRSGRTASQFATGMQYVAGIAAELEVPLLDVATALSFLESRGIMARSAGTGLRTLFLELASGGEKLAEIGITAFDPTTGAFVGLPSIIDQFSKFLDTMPDEQALSFLEDFFGKPAASPLLTLFRGGIEAYDEHQKKMLELGTAAEFVKTLMDTVAGSMDRLGAASSNAGRKLGAALGPVIKPVLDGLTGLLGLFGQAPPIVHGLVAALIALAGALMMIGGAMMVFRALGGWAIFTAALGGIGTVALIAAAAIGIIVAALVLLGDKLGFIGDATDAVLKVGGPFLDYLADIDQGSGTWNEHLEKLPPNLRRTAHGVGTVVEAFADLWYFLSRGDFDRFMNRLPGELRQMGSGFRAIGEEIMRGLRAVDWGAVASTIGEGLAGLVIPIGSVIIRIGGWLIESSVELWPEITRFVYGLFGGNDDSLAVEAGRGTAYGVRNQGAAIPLGVIAVRIESWAVQAAESLWDEIIRFIFGGPVISEAGSAVGLPIAQDSGLVGGLQAIPLGTVAVEIGGWLVEGGEDIGSAVRNKVIELWPAAKGAGLGLLGYTIKLWDWAVEQGEDLGGKIQDKILEWWPSIKDSGAGLLGHVIDLGQLAVEATIDVAGELGSVVKNTGGWLKNKITGGIGRAIDVGEISLKGTIKFVSEGGEGDADGGGMGGAIKSLFRTSFDALTTSGDFLADVGSGLLGLLTGGLDKLASISIPEGYDLGKPVGAFIGRAIVAAVGVITGQGEAGDLQQKIALGIIGFFVGAFHLLGDIGNASSTAAVAIQDAVAGLGKGIIGFLGGVLVGEFEGATGEDFSDVAGAIGNWFARLFQNVFSGQQDAPPGVSMEGVWTGSEGPAQALVTRIVTTIINALTELPGALIEGLSQIQFDFGFISDTIQGALNAIDPPDAPEWITDPIGWIKSQWRSGEGSFMSSAFDYFLDGKTRAEGNDDEFGFPGPEDDRDPGVEPVGLAGAPRALTIPAPDVSVFSRALTAAMDSLSSFGRLTAKATLEADIDPFANRLLSAVQSGIAFGAQVFRSTLDADIGPFANKLFVAINQGLVFGGSTFTASLDADTSPFWAAVSSIVGQTVGTAFVSVQASPSSILAGANLPGFAAGGYFQGPGAFIAGEAGPELVMSSGSARIHNASDTRKLAGGTTVVQVFGLTSDEYLKLLRKAERSGPEAVRQIARELSLSL